MLQPHILMGMHFMYFYKTNKTSEKRFVYYLFFFNFEMCFRFPLVTFNNSKKERAENCFEIMLYTQSQRGDGV